MLEAGTLDIALVQGEVVHAALQGVGRAPADLRVLTAMYPTAGMFVVRADSPYRTIADLKGKPIAWGAGGSGLVILGRYAMDGLGLDAARDFQPIYLERAGDGPAMVLDGRAAALWGGGNGWPGFMAMARSQDGARFIAPDGDEIRRILAKHPFLKPVTQPAGSFPGQAAAIPSVGSWSFVLARPGLDETVAYRIVKALHALQQAGNPPPQLVDTTAANTVAVVPGHEKLHPGAARFYREIGLLT
jgi:TRAP transporter TAXI family solute receptor